MSQWALGRRHWVVNSQLDVSWLINMDVLGTVNVDGLAAAGTDDEVT